MVTPAQAGLCQQYALQVRQAHFLKFGISYPWHYALGQLQQESGCRNIMSNDGVGSQGLPQITWSIWRDTLERNDVHSLGTTAEQFRAQAVINLTTWQQAKLNGAPVLWAAFQVYNGGSLVLKEIAAAGRPDWQAARGQCHRRDVVFNRGRPNEQTVNACDINYDYSQRIYRYGQAYKAGVDSLQFPFWGQ